MTSEDQALAVVQEMVVGIREGDARLLTGAVMAALKYRSMEQRIRDLEAELAKCPFDEPDHYLCDCATYRAEKAEVEVERLSDDHLLTLDGLVSERDRLQDLLAALVVAAGRMRDQWADADDTVRKRLWADLHNAADAAGETVYPLRDGDA